jgi:hypothetical protein
VAPLLSESTFGATLARIEKLIPGDGPLAQWYTSSQKQFNVPPARLDFLFRGAIEEARRRTTQRITMPRNESFRLEYSKGQVWQAYNFYKGDAQSLIQVNTDLPVDVNFVVRLACHEGYLGIMCTEPCVKIAWYAGAGGWNTRCLLFGPQALMMEGGAEYAGELVFPPVERLTFLEQVLFPLAGLDVRQVRRSDRVQRAVASLDPAIAMAARRYVDRRISRDECRSLLERYALQPPDIAESQTQFTEKNRSYVINYNVGKSIVRRYMKRGRSTPADAWKRFEMLSTPPRVRSSIV